jgi:hypothetical protein
MADTEVEGSDLSAIVADEIRQAQTFDQSKRALAIEYQRGEMTDLPARTNGSSQTDRTFADALGWTLPGVVRVFTASDQMVQFEATQEGGEQGAEEASEYTNYSFFRENDGYRILYNGTYDSLLMGNGAACSYWCPEESKTKLFRDKTLEELAVLMEDGWQGLGVAPQVTGTDPETNGPLFTVRLKLVTERGQIRDMTLKPENLLLNSSATELGERFTAYLHDDKTRSDLLGMADEYGWDKEAIANLPSFRQIGTNVVTAARFTAEQSMIDDAPTKSGDKIDLYECYVRLDQDGDGEAELLQVWYAGNAGSGLVLSSDEWEDDVPFTDIPCYPIPHQWQAESLFDRTADIQRVKTTLLRQLLDNAYAVGLPMQEVEEGSVLNPDILVNKKFGGLIWKKKGSNPIQPHDTPFIGDKLMLGLEYMDNMLGKRTGISKTTMALDPEALQNQTATGTQLQHDAGYSQIELIARNMAELGWSKFFAKRRNLAKKYIKEPVKIPSRNGDAPQGLDPQMQPGMDAQPKPQPSAYRTIQPEKWSDDMACTINVGLGTGSRDRDMSMLNLILNGQVGMAERLGNIPSPTAKKKAAEFIGKIRKTSVEMAESSGLKNPDDYYPPISDEEIQAIEQEMVQASQQPDPKIAADQAKAASDAQIAQMKAQNDMQSAQAKLVSDAQIAGQKLQLETQKAEAEAVTKHQQLQAELHLKQQQLVAELQMKQQQFMAELALQRELGHAKVQAQADVTSSVHPGGAPG